MTRIICNCTCSSLTHDLTKANDAMDGGCFGVRKKYLVMALIAVVFILALCFFWFRPAVVGRVDVPDKYLEAIESQSKGVYSRTIFRTAPRVTVRGEKSILPANTYMNLKVSRMQV